MNVEFGELLNAKTAGKIMEQITVSLDKTLTFLSFSLSFCFILIHSLPILASPSLFTFVSISVFLLTFSFSLSWYFSPFFAFLFASPFFIFTWALWMQIKVYACWSVSKSHLDLLFSRSLVSLKLTRVFYPKASALTYIQFAISLFQDCLG